MRAPDPPHTPAASNATLDFACVMWRVIDTVGEASARRDPGSTFLGDLGFDSLQLVTMYAICEELFGVELLDSDAVLDCVTVGQLIAHLSDRMSKGAARLPNERAMEELLEASA